MITVGRPPTRAAERGAGMTHAPQQSHAHRDGGGNPDTLLLSDRPLQIALFLWLVVVMAAIYVVHYWNA